jgi:hypothetical protein
LHTDKATQKTGPIQQGDRIETKVNDQNQRGRGRLSPSFLYASSKQTHMVRLYMTEKCVVAGSYGEKF